MRIPSFVLVMCLTSCATATFEGPCPALPIYSPEIQTRAAQEIESLGPDSVTKQLVADYGAMRAEVRVCRGLK